MIVLRINNSYCNIEGLNQKQFNELRDLMSYNIAADAKFYSGFKGSYKRYLLDKKGFFPSGIRYIAEDYLKYIDHKLIDARIVPKSQSKLFNLKLCHSPYPEQKDAVKAARVFKQGTIRAVTGFGKSLVIAMLINEFQLKTLVIVPNLGLKKQMEDSFVEMFGSLNNISVENIDSSNLDKDSKYDVLIIDEAHHAASDTYRRLNKTRWTNIYYRFNLTATPFRSRDEEQLLMEGITGRVFYSISYKKAVDKDYIVSIEAYYIEVPKTKTEGYTWQEVYSNLVVNNKVRNDIIKELLKLSDMLGTPTLCLVKEINHGKNICEDRGLPFISGTDKDSKKYLKMYNMGQICTLVGTSGVLGEGIDTKPAEFIIIAGLGKSKNQFMQQIGRGLRKYMGKESAKIIIFKDNSHKWCKSHFSAQCKILKEEYGAVPIKLDIA